MVGVCLLGPPEPQTVFKPTDRPTDRPRYSICNNRPHLHSTQMRSSDKLCNSVATDGTNQWHSINEIYMSIYISLRTFWTSLIDAGFQNTLALKAKFHYAIWLEAGRRLLLAVWQSATRSTLLPTIADVTDNLTILISSMIRQ